MFNELKYMCKGWYKKVMGTGPYSLSPTVAKCAANKEVNTAFS